MRAEQRQNKARMPDCWSDFSLEKTTFSRHGSGCQAGAQTPYSALHRDPWQYSAQRPLTVLCTIVCTALHCNTLDCTAPHCTALHCCALHSTALHCTAQHWTAVQCSAVHCTALHCTALQCTTLHCTALNSILSLHGQGWVICLSQVCTVSLKVPTYSHLLYCTSLDSTNLFYGQVL